MNRLASQISQSAYQKVIKPILFRRLPDDVHSKMVHLGRSVQSFRAINKLTSWAWSYRKTDYLSQTVVGLKFNNPVGLSAGLDKNFELPPIVKAIGMGFMEGGSLTLQPCAGNPHPWFHRLPEQHSLVVNAGLPNEGVTAIIQRLRSYPPNLFDDFPLNISVAKTNSKISVGDSAGVADYVGSLRQLAAARLGSIYTLNISCPNTYGGEPFTTPDRLKLLLNAVDRLKLNVPVFIKMPISLSWTEFDKLLREIIKHRVSGVTIGNLSKDRHAVNLPDHIKGNLSGRPTFELSNQLIRQTYRHYGNRLTIIGVGGIFTADDAYRKIRLGASLVEMITGLIFNGPQTIGQINRGLVELLQRDGLHNISEAIGADNPIVAKSATK